MIELTNFAEDLKMVFIAHGIQIPDSKVNEIAQLNLKMVEEFNLFQKYGRLALKVSVQQIHSFKEIIKPVGFIDSFNEHLKKNETCFKFILGPVSSTIVEELVLYWEGKDQSIPGGTDIYWYFMSKGFEVVERAHPSLLIGAISQLTEEKMMELSIPLNVELVLPTSEDSLLPNRIGDSCFLKTSYYNGKRELGLRSFNGTWLEDFAFLLRRMKS